MGDRITEIRIEGMRTIESLRLPLKGLTVLIGENATGKSTIIEALEILRRAPSEGFYNDLHQIHGGASSLIRIGAKQLKLGVRAEGDGDPLDYDFEITAQEGGSLAITNEILRVHSEPPRVELDRGAALAKLPTLKGIEAFQSEVRGDKLMITGFGRYRPNRNVERLVSVLQQISVHPAFDVLTAWAGRAMARPTPMRSSVPLQMTDRLLPTGSNLANAYLALKNTSEKQWQETLDWIRLGLGWDVETINTKPDPGGGAINLAVKYRGLDRDVWASSLSDGTLAFLAMVACIRLGDKRSLLAIDEPELHLHPLLLGRVVQYLEIAAEEYPVVVATHSDRLLDALPDPAGSVVLCELDHERRTVLSRPDRQELAKWLQRYGGYGELRAAGHALSVMERPDQQ